VELVGRASAHRGCVMDAELERALIRLMRTFSARSPTTLARIERGMAGWIETNRPVVERIAARARLDRNRKLALSYADPRMPVVAARAALTATIVNDALNDARWLDGDVHIVHESDFNDALGAIGAPAFVTFDDPVVEWGGSGFLIATLSLAPDRMIAVVHRGADVSPAHYGGLVVQHAMKALPWRQQLIASDKVTGLLLEAVARDLRPLDA
jgi:hypothetical protein